MFSRTYEGNNDKNLLTLRSPLTARISWAKLCVIFALNLKSLLPFFQIVICLFASLMSEPKILDSVVNLYFLMLVSSTMLQNSGKVGIHMAYSIMLYLMLSKCLLKLESSWVRSQIYFYVMPIFKHLLPIAFYNYVKLHLHVFQLLQVIY